MRTRLHTKIKYRSRLVFVPVVVSIICSVLVFTGISHRFGYNAASTETLFFQKTLAFRNEPVFYSLGNSTNELCRSNSRLWIQGPRLGNSLDSSYDDKHSRRMIESLTTLTIGRARNLLQQTMCHAKSNFVSNLIPHESDNDNEAQTIRRWTTRLVYLAMHAHQHAPALSEAKQRSNCLGVPTVGQFDYECPNAKFLVVRFFSNGIGANMRLAAVPAFMAGITSGRQVVFVNNARVGPDFLRRPWKLASCDRHDAQCFFLPATPCVMTDQQLETAHVLSKQQVRQFMRTGELLDHENDRVLITKLSFRPQREPASLRPKMHKRMLAIAKQLVAQDNESQLKKILQNAADSILKQDERPANTINYYGANSPLFHGLLLYAMRPNPRAAMSLRVMLEKNLPSSFTGESSIGLPIRGKKCRYALWYICDNSSRGSKITLTSSILYILRIFSQRQMRRRK
jgi:hypothetical protein